MVSTAPGTGSLKLGQPVPLSNFFFDTNSGWSQPAQVKVPARFSIVERAAARRLGAVLAHDVVLLGRQQLAPFGVGAGDGVLPGCPWSAGSGSGPERYASVRGRGSPRIVRTLPTAGTRTINVRLLRITGSARLSAFGCCDISLALVGSNSESVDRVRLFLLGGLQSFESGFKAPRRFLSRRRRPDPRLFARLGPTGHLSGHRGIGVRLLCPGLFAHRRPGFLRRRLRASRGQSRPRSRSIVFPHFQKHRCQPAVSAKIVPAKSVGFRSRRLDLRSLDQESIDVPVFGARRQRPRHPDQLFKTGPRRRSQRSRVLQHSSRLDRRRAFHQQTLDFASQRQDSDRSDPPHHGVRRSVCRNVSLRFSIQVGWQSKWAWSISARMES